MRACRWLVAAVLTTLVPQAARASDSIDYVVDPYYFENAASKLNQDMKGVLIVLVSHEGKPSKRGVKTLDLRKRPDGAAPTDEPCERLYARKMKPDPSAPVRPEAKQVCDLRLLGWSPEDSEEDRFQFSVTRVQRTDKGNWVEIVRDPEEDRRSWIQLVSDGAVGKDPIMEFQTLGRWIGSTGAVRRRPYRAFDTFLLLNSPRMGAQVVTTQSSAIDVDRQNVRRIVNAPRFDPNAHPMRYLGVQGAWIRVELVTRDCRSETEDPYVFDSIVPRCVAGWVRWRDPDGELFLYPASAQSLEKGQRPDR